MQTDFTPVILVDTLAAFVAVARGAVDIPQLAEIALISTLGAV